MAELKTRPTGGAREVKAFVAAIADPAQRADAEALLKLMRELTGQPPRLWGDSMVGFGSYHYTYASGRDGDWFPVGFSPRKANLTIYVLAGFDRHAALLGRLGKHKTAKSCLYVKRLADLDLAILRRLLAGSLAQLGQQ
ncbi:DUF1801 domain-containing protein [bacterium]|nr:DUF1801 domain-containing protein [bacterium]